MGSTGTNGCSKTGPFFEPKRPTSFVFDLQVAANSNSNGSAMNSPMYLGTPKSSAGTPMCLGTPLTPVAYASVFITPLTPRSKRNAEASDLYSYSEARESTKWLMMDPSAPNLKLKQNVHAVYNDNDDEEWNESAPPLPKLEPPTQIRVTDSPLTPSREFAVPRRRLPGTPSADNECWEVTDSSWTQRQNEEFWN